MIFIGLLCQCSLGLLPTFMKVCRRGEGEREEEGEDGDRKVDERVDCVIKTVELKINVLRNRPCY
jgi:hypothetical protein